MNLVRFFKSLMSGLLIVLLLAGCNGKATVHKQVDASKVTLAHSGTKVTIGGAFSSHITESGRYASGRSSCENPDGTENPDPDEFQVVADQTLISGTGEPKATINVYDTYNAVKNFLCSATVLSDGQWTCGLQKVSGEGQHLLTAEQVISSQVNSTDKVNYKVKQDEEDDKDPLDKGGDGTDGHGGGNNCNRGGGEDPNSGPGSNLPYQTFPLAADAGLLSSLLGAFAAGAAGLGSLIAGGFELGADALAGLGGAASGVLGVFNFFLGGNPIGSPIKILFSPGSKIFNFTLKTLFDSGVKKLVPGNDYSMEVSVYKSESDYPDHPWMRKFTLLRVPSESGIPTSGSLSISAPKESQVLPFNKDVTVSGYDESGAKVTISSKVKLGNSTHTLCIVTADKFKQWSCVFTPSAYNVVGPSTITAKDDKGQNVSVKYVSYVTDLSINRPYPFETIIRPTYQISGTGESGLSVMVKDENNRQVCNPNISESGYWICSGIRGVPGQHTIYAGTLLQGYMPVGNIESVTFNVAKGVSNSLTIMSPANKATVESSPYFIQGTALPNESIVVTGLPGGDSCNTYSDIESGIWQCGPYKSTSTQDVTITASMSQPGASDYAQVVSTYYLRPEFTVESPIENQVLDINSSNYTVRGRASSTSIVVVHGLGYIADCRVVVTNGQWACGPYPLELGEHRIKVNNFSNPNDEAKNINLNSPILRKFSTHYPITVYHPDNGGNYLGKVQAWGISQLGSTVTYSFDGVESGVASGYDSYGVHSWGVDYHLLAKGQHTFVATVHFNGDTHSAPAITFNITQNDPHLFTLGTTAPAENSYIPVGTAPGSYNLNISDGTGQPGYKVKYKIGCFDTKWAMQDSDCSTDFNSDNYQFEPVTINAQGLWAMPRAYSLPAGRYILKAAEFDSNDKQVSRTLLRNFTIYAADYLTFGDDAPTDGSYRAAPYTLNSTNGHGQAGLTVKYRLVCINDYGHQCVRPGVDFNLGPVDITDQGWSLEAPFPDMPKGTYDLEAGLFSKDGNIELANNYVYFTFNVANEGESQPVNHNQPILIESPINGYTITTPTYSIKGIADSELFEDSDSKINVYYVDPDTSKLGDKICASELHFNPDYFPANWSCDGIRSVAGGSFTIMAIFGEGAYAEEIHSNKVTYNFNIPHDRSFDIMDPSPGEPMYTPGNITIDGYGHPSATVKLTLTNLDTSEVSSLTGDTPLPVNNYGKWSGSYRITGKVGSGETNYFLEATQSRSGYSDITKHVSFTVHCTMLGVEHGSC